MGAICLSSIGDCVSILLMIIGFIFLVLSFFPAQHLLYAIKNLPNFKYWLILVFFMLFFAVSYVAMIVTVLTRHNKFGNLLPGLILFGGAVFVFMILRISYKTVVELQATTAGLHDATSRYKHLLESANDIIFTINKTGIIESINSSVKKHLGYNPAEMIGTNITDYVYRYGDDNYGSLIFEKKIAELVKSGKFVRLIVDFRQKYNLEPKSVNVVIELVKIEDDFVIMGKCSLPIDDFMLSAFRSEHQVYTFGNFLVNAEYVSQRACRNLLQYIPESEVNKLRIALREIIFNAIEHGNLNITFEEKSSAMLTESYQKLISERQNDPRYKIRNVTVEYSISADVAEFVVTDEGLGFDKKILEAHENEELSPHGRGIPIAVSVFDTVDFNDKGNVITLRKKIRNL